MHRIDRIFLRLQPVAWQLRNHDLAKAIGPVERLPVGQLGRRRRSHIGPQQPGMGAYRIGVDLDLVLIPGLRDDGILERHFDTLAALVIGPAMIVAAQPAFLDKAVRQIGAAVRALTLDQPEPVAEVAIEHQIFAEEADRLDPLGIEFAGPRHGKPVAPQHVAHLGAGADPGQQYILGSVHLTLRMGLGFETKTRVDICQRLAIDRDRLRIEQHESDARRFIRARVAPAMDRAALNDDAARFDHRRGLVVEDQLDRARNDDPVVEAAGAVHRRGRARQHIDDANHRAARQGDVGIAVASVGGIVIVDRRPVRGPEQREQRGAGRVRDAVQPAIGNHHGLPAASWPVTTRRTGGNVGISAPIGNHGAAIDDDHLAIDESTGGRGKEHRGAGNLFGLADAAQRGHLHAPRHERLIAQQPVGKARRDQSRGDCIGPHPPRSPLHRQVTRQLGDARLGQRIGIDARIAAQPGDAGNQDHRSAIAVRHHGQRVAGQHRHRPQIDSDDAVEDRHVERIGRRPALDPGVGHKNVDAAETVGRRCDQCGDRSVVGDIARDTDPAQLCGGRGGVAGILARHDHRRAMRNQRLGDRIAQPARRPGHHRDLARKVEQLRHLPNPRPMALRRRAALYSCDKE
eukprot:Opistho-1_new@109511